MNLEKNISLKKIVDEYYQLLLKHNFNYFKSIKEIPKLDDSITIDESIRKWFYYAHENNIKIPKKINLRYFLKKNDGKYYNYNIGNTLHKASENFKIFLNFQHHKLLSLKKNLIKTQFENENTSKFSFLNFFFIVKSIFFYKIHNDLYFFLKNNVKNKLLYTFFKKIYYNIFNSNFKNFKNKFFNKKNINLIGYSRGNFGVAENLKRLFYSIDKKKYNLFITNVNTNSYHVENDKTLIKYEKRFSNFVFSSINILCVNADQTLLVSSQTNLYPFNLKIGYWFWELERFPKIWNDSEKNIDVLWAPSFFIMDSLKNFSKKKVQYMPISIEFKVDNKITRDFFSIPKNTFVFFFNFDFASFVERKNPFDLIKCFKYAFLNNENVELCLKISNEDKFKKNYDDLLGLINNDNRIRILNKNYSDLQMNSLYNLIDVYCSLHRSEGFGLGLAKAMYLGKPVIGTAYSGNMTFMNDENSCLVDYTLIEVRKYQYPHYQNQLWANPNLKTAVDFMRRLFKDKNFYINKSNFAKSYIKKYHSISSARIAFDRNINELS